MAFYDRVIRELKRDVPALSTVYKYAFRFSDEVYFEQNDGEHIYTETYREAEKRVERLTNALHVALKDVEKGACVGLYLPNCPTWVISFWAILRCGYRPLLLNTNASEAVVKSCLERAGATHLISERTVSGYRNLHADVLLEQEHPYFLEWADEIVLCTSGTTGEPKLIVFDGKAVYAQIQNSGYVLKQNRSIASFYRGKIKLLAFLPFYHIFGLSAVLLWFSCFGRTMVFLPNLSPETIQNTCKLHGVTHIFAMPLFWNLISDAIYRTARKMGQTEKLEKGLRLSEKLQSGPFAMLGTRFVRNVLFRSVQEQALGSGVRFCITGGGTIRQKTLSTINGIGYPLYNGYGMTEIGIASVELRRFAKRRNEGSIGKLFPSMEGKLADVDADGNGTLFVRGETCFVAEFRDGRRIEHDPHEWFDTQDCMCRKKGHLYFAGRQDDLINGENGERISPNEIEAAFGSPLMQNLCVVPTTDENGATRITLVVEPKSRNTYRMAKLMEELKRANATLTHTHRVDRVLIANEPLPLSLTMKVSNKEVRERLKAGTLSVTEADLSATVQENAYEEGMEEIIKEVIEIFRRATDCEEVTQDSHFVYDLGGDSLTFFSVVEELRALYGVDMDTTADLSTPRLCATYLLKEME